MTTRAQTIAGFISCDTTLCGCVILDGIVRVVDGATVTIEPGTQLIAKHIPSNQSVTNPFTALIFCRGTKIRALGTFKNPIVATTDAPVGCRRRGLWGGIVIYGKAPVTIGIDAGGKGTTENEYFLPGLPGIKSDEPQCVGGGGVVNGKLDFNHENDDSGIIRYMRIEYTGQTIVTGTPATPPFTLAYGGLAGLNLVGVGSMTNVEHIQVSYSGTNSFDFMGGNVSAHHLISEAAAGDDFHSDLGHEGCLNNRIAWRQPNLVNDDGEVDPYQTITVGVFDDLTGPGQEWIPVSFAGPSANFLATTTGLINDQPAVPWELAVGIGGFTSNGTFSENSALFEAPLGTVVGLPPVYPPPISLELLGRPTSTYFTNGTVVGLEQRTYTTPGGLVVVAVGYGIIFAQGAQSQVTNDIELGFWFGLRVEDPSGDSTVTPLTEQEILNTLIAANSQGVDPSGGLVEAWFTSAWKQNVLSSNQSAVVLRCPYAFVCPDMRPIPDKSICRGAVLDSHNPLAEPWVECQPNKVVYCNETGTTIILQKINNTTADPVSISWNVAFNGLNKTITASVPAGGPTTVATCVVCPNMDVVITEFPNTGSLTGVATSYVDAQGMTQIITTVDALPTYTILATDVVANRVITTVNTNN